jgi:uncharacterized RmlC-like cupin family protein
MEHFHRSALDVDELPGRAIQRAVGKGAHSASGKMTVGFATYAKRYGPMEPHHHAEEVIYVVDAKNAWVEWGPAKDQLTERADLNPGTMLHVPSLEWHVFRTQDDGFLDIVFIYGQVDNIRPEDSEK